MSHPSVKNGILGGIIMVIVSLILWFIKPDYFQNYNNYFSFVILLIFLYLAGKEGRDANEGYLSYGDMFKYLFIAFVFFSLISTIFNYILFNYIDTQLIVDAKEKIFEKMEEQAAKQGNEDQIEKMQEIAVKLIPYSSVWITFAYWFISLVFGAIISAIMAAFMKKEAPVFRD